MTPEQATELLELVGTCEFHLRGIAVLLAMITLLLGWLLYGVWCCNTK